jgi:hypothetical protein
MGYDTSFDGFFSVTPTLKDDHRKYLKAFSNTRRMRRDPRKAILFNDPLREKVGLPIGEDGCFFVGGKGLFGDEEDKSVINYNIPPLSQPGLWCKWKPDEEGGKIEWNGVEKFREYIPWISYLIKKFLAPWRYKLNGTVRWYGEREFDKGKIVIDKNLITVVPEIHMTIDELEAYCKNSINRPLRERSREAHHLVLHLIDFYRNKQTL